LLPLLGRVKLSLRPATVPGSRGSCEGSKVFDEVRFQFVDVSELVRVGRCH